MYYDYDEELDVYEGCNCIRCVSNRIKYKRKFTGMRAIKDTYQTEYTINKTGETIAVLTGQGWSQCYKTVWNKAELEDAIRLLKEEGGVNKKKTEIQKEITLAQQKLTNAQRKLRDLK